MRERVTLDAGVSERDDRRGTSIVGVGLVGAP